MTFKIFWSTHSGRFGWTEIAECIDLGDAIGHFTAHVIGADVPADAVIDEIKTIPG